jgi:hypothetical protein
MARGARSASDIVEASLQTVEFLDDGERNHHFTPGEGAQTGGIGDENRGIENDPGATTGTPVEGWLVVVVVAVVRRGRPGVVFLG